MIRFTSMAAAAALLAGMAPLAACASNGETSAHQPQAQTTTPPPAAPQATTGYTDAQIDAFVAARSQINQLTPGTTTEEQQQNQIRISQILQEAGVTPEQYNQILEASQTDQTLSNRIAVAAVGDSLSDDQLRAFITASAEIEPLSATLTSGTETERAQAAEQIRGILARNNLTIEVYNGIAAQARTNAELQARLQALNAPADAPSGSE